MSLFHCSFKSSTRCRENEAWAIESEYLCWGKYTVGVERDVLPGVVREKQELELYQNI